MVLRILKFIEILKISTKIYCIICIINIVQACFSLQAETISVSIPDLNTVHPTISLVLSGGGARGFTQVGVLKEFEKNNIRINYVVGTSIGSILGGLYSSGYSAEDLDSLVMNTKWSDIFTISDENSRTDYFLDQKQINDRSFLSLRFNRFRFIVPEAISLGVRSNYFIQNLLWNGIYQPIDSYDDLKYKFRAVSTDVLSGQSISFSKGNIVAAIRASSALPLRYSPVRIDDRILVDGGILANIPVKQAKEFNPDMIIAVNSTSPLFTSEDLDKPWNLADQVVSVAMKQFENDALKLADYVITPKINSHKNTDFNNLDSLIKKGEEAARVFIPGIKKRITDYKDSVFNSCIYNIKAKLQQRKDVEISCSGLDFTDSIKIRSLNLFFVYDKFEEIIKNFNKYSEIKITYQYIDSTNHKIFINAKKYNFIKKIIIQSDYSNISKVIEDSINSNTFCLTRTDDNYSEIKERIIKCYINAGYNLCTIDNKSISIKNDTLILSVTIPKIKNIVILGNETIGEYLIRRDFTFNIGDFVNADKLCHTWESVFNTNWFSSIDMWLELDNNLKDAVVKIRVKELGTQIINLGLRADNERKTQLGLDLIQENLFNMGTRFNIRFYAGERNLSTSLTLEQPRFFDTYYTFKIQTYYNYSRISDYINKTNLSDNEFDYSNLKDIGIQTYGLKISAGSQLERNGRIGAELRFEKQRFYESAILSSLKPDYYSVNTLKIEAIFDSKDKIDFPKKGRLLGLSFETNVFSSEKSFSKAIFEYNTNHTYGLHTFSPTFYFGFADLTMPLPEFFDLGGQDRFFGLLENQEKGRQIARGSFEYRIHSPYSLFFDTYFSVRYDLGAVWIKTEEIKFRDFKHGLGATLAFDTPVGPAKFSVGQAFYFKQNPYLLVKGPIAIYFSIGMKL